MKKILGTENTITCREVRGKDEMQILLDKVYESDVITINKYSYNSDSFLIIFPNIRIIQCSMFTNDLYSVSLFVFISIFLSYFIEDNKKFGNSKD